MNLAFLSFLLGSLALRVYADSSLNTATANILPNRFIIEVDRASSLRRRGRDVHPLDAMYHELNKRAFDVNFTREFKSDGIFNGVAITVNNLEDISLIKKTPGVKAVRPIRSYSTPKPKQLMVVNERDATSQLVSINTLTGVDRVHANGINGKGIKIAIIDSGIDTTHPALSNVTVVHAYDFTVDGTARPDTNGTDCLGHGTQIAGIIAAQPGNAANLTGVAYGVQLGSYRVFHCSETVDDDKILAAMLKADSDDMDIFNLSLGRVAGWSEATLSVVADRLTKKGRIIVVAAGNEGASGPWNAYAPASGQDVISVGSVDNTVTPVLTATIQSADRDYPPIIYSARVPFNGSLPVYTPSSDPCSPLRSDTPNLAVYIAVVPLGNCSFLTILNNVRDKGNGIILFYGDLKDVQGSLDNISFINDADGQYLAQQLLGGKQLNITFGIDFSEVSNDNGGLVSDYSSYGPSFDFVFTPSLSAPGKNVLSTYPVINGSYMIGSGTSFATPFTAACAALILAAKGKDMTVLTGVKTLLQTTSTKIQASNAAGFETLIKSGAGLVNVYDAIYSTTLVSTGELILNDTAHFVSNHSFKVQNTGNSTQHYIVAHIPALTALTMKNNSIIPTVDPVPLVDYTAIVDISPSNLTIQPGGTEEVKVRFQLPDGDASLYPLFSGFIGIASEFESHRVSYIGLGASLRDHQLFDDTSSVLNTSTPALVDSNQNVLDQATNYTFRDDDYPKLLIRLAMGTPLLRLDLVDPDIQFTPTNQRRGLAGGRDITLREPADVNIVASLFQKYYMPRDTRQDSGGDVVALKRTDLGSIPNGRYRMLLRALRITGNPDSEEDYDSWLSPIIGVNA